ncbi:MAG: tryptophan synthase subunit alpha [Candidatus Zixiibacteriota bacterium]|nr:MAG: tryptophan synthase subunit alpha [candidate division Zixibacteria bacterium]
MSRVTRVMTTRSRRKLLIPFFTAGFPDYRTTLALLKEAVKAGVDLLEIGMPFSDPMADGPSIQHSSHAALQKGTDLRQALRLVGDLRKTTLVPIILMGYYNPILSYGESRFVSDAARAGADGFIIPDLPVEESLDFRKLCDQAHLSSIFLVSPTSSEGRMRLIAEACTDFVYAVTVTGVTGGGKKFGRETSDYLMKLKRTLGKPFVAGFGVSSAEAAARLVRFADGVVIGSRLIDIVRYSDTTRQGVRSVGRFLRAVRKAVG